MWKVVLTFQILRRWSGTLASRNLRFQIILEHDGLQRVTDVPLAGLDIARVALEAEAQNLGMTQFLTQTVTTAIKKDMIEKILREPSPDPAPQAGPESP